MSPISATPPVRAEPSKADWKRLVARAHRSLGEILPLLGEAPSALPHLRQAVALLEAVSAGAPADVSARLDLSSAYEMLGDVSGRSGIVSLGDADAARDAFQKALAIGMANDDKAAIAGISAPIAATPRPRWKAIGRPPRSPPR